MKKIVCPKCKKKMARTIGFYWKAQSVYYLNSGRTSVNKFYGDITKKQGDKWTINLGFFCNKCGVAYPEKMWKEIRLYLKNDIIVQKLKNVYTRY